MAKKRSPPRERMGMLTALKARVKEGTLDGGDGEGDGYYVRTNDNCKIGPMTGEMPVRRN